MKEKGGREERGSANGNDVQLVRGVAGEEELEASDRGFVAGVGMLSAGGSCVYLEGPSR